MTSQPCEFTDGDSQDVKAGQGLGFGIGGWFRPAASVPFELQALIGYKVVFTAAENADIKMTRSTLQLNGVYRFVNDWYVGAGYVQHMSPELDGDGFFEDFEFDNASGFNAEVGWKWVAPALHQDRLFEPRLRRRRREQRRHSPHVSLRTVDQSADSSSPDGVRSIRGTPCGRESPCSWAAFRRPASGTACPPPGAPSRTLADARWSGAAR